MAGPPLAGQRPNNPQDRKAWWVYGEYMEDIFLEQARFLGVRIYKNPDKYTNKYAHAFFVERDGITYPADFNGQLTPFRSALILHNISPIFAISINRNNVEEYVRTYPDMMLVIDVNYTEGIPYNGTHLAPIKDVQHRIESGSARLQIYKNRVDDLNNNPNSYVFDVRWFERLIQVP